MKEKTTSTELVTAPAKILFIITKSNFGGAQRYVFELATRLKKDGYSIAVALGGNGALKTKLEEEDVEVFSITGAQRDISITKEIQVLWRIFSIIREYKPDVVHLNSPKIGGLGSVAARLAYTINRTKAGKIIYTNHGWAFNEPRPEWQQILIRIFSWLTVFLGGTTIVLGKTERNDVRGWPFVQNKFVIIPNGVSDFHVYDKKTSLTRLVGEQKAQEWIAEKRLIIGTISELHKNKGLTFALEGLNSYIEQYPTQKIAYVVIGEGEERKALEENIKKLSHLHPEHVVLAGQIPEAREYVGAFDLFLLSSVKEGLPFAILEAGSAGIPVISTSVGGIPEVIQNLENGILIAPRRPQEIKNALAYLDEHPEVNASMVLKFKEKIKEKNKKKKIIADIKKLYGLK